MPCHVISEAHEWINEIPSVTIYSPQAELAYVSIWGLGNPRSRSQGSVRRDKVPGTLFLEAPAYVCPIWNC